MAGMLVRILGAATLWAALVSVPAMSAEAERIVVMGEGRAAAEPDMAIIDLGLRAEAPTAREASARLAAALETVLAGIEAEGVAARDVRTVSLLLQPLWDQRPGGQGPPRIRGQVASSVLRIRLRDLDRLGGVLDRVVADGVGQVSGLQLALQDPAPLDEAARRAAVADARLRAETYSEAAGAALGRLLEIAELEAGDLRPAMRFEAAMASGEGLMLASGEIEAVSRIRAIFALVSGDAR